jgi:hypothetical protein
MQRTHQTLPITISLIITIFILLSACTPVSSTTPTPDADTVITQAAQTVAAHLTQNPPVTSTMAPTNPPLPTETSSGLAPTVGLPTAPPPATLTPAPNQTNTQAILQDNASFVADVTIPDGASITPGSQFVKTWRIKNSGKTTWTTSYTLVPIDGERMGSPDSIPMPNEVRPGETADISVNLTAPTKPGNFQTFFRLRNANNQYFRLDGTGDLWFKIVVGSETTTPMFTQTATSVPPTATSTP